MISTLTSTITSLIIPSIVTVQINPTKSILVGGVQVESAFSTTVVDGVTVVVSPVVISFRMSSDLH